MLFNHDPQPPCYSCVGPPLCCSCQGYELCHGVLIWTNVHYWLGHTTDPGSQVAQAKPWGAQAEHLTHSAASPTAFLFDSVTRYVP